MVFIRRHGPAGARFTGLRVGLLFLAVGVWLAGIQLQSDHVTGIAIGIAAFAILIGVLGRRRKDGPAAEPKGEEEEEEEEEEIER